MYIQIDLSFGFILQRFLTPDGFISLFALVGRNGQGIGTSPFATWSKRVEKDVQVKFGSFF